MLSVNRTAEISNVHRTPSGAVGHKVGRYLPRRAIFHFKKKRNIGSPMTSLNSLSSQSIGRLSSEMVADIFAI